MIKAEDIEIVVASEKTVKYVDEILDTITRAAKVRGTGIAKRSPEYVKQKMLENKAVVALYKGEEFAGFSYIESWSNKQFVANSGLIVANKFRGLGLANRIKRRIFELSRERFPHAKIFSLTTGAAVMKINNKHRSGHQGNGRSEALNEQNDLSAPSGPRDGARAAVPRRVHPGGNKIS